MNTSMGSTIREGGTQHWAGKALSLSNERWLKRARGAALKRDRSTLWAYYLRVWAGMGIGVETSDGRVRIKDVNNS